MGAAFQAGAFQAGAFQTTVVSSVTTLLQARTDHLNVDLGLTADTDDTFGTTAERNYAIRRGIARLWPRMPRQLIESPTVVADQLEYTLTSIRAVEAVDSIDADGTVHWDRFANWRVLNPETTAATIGVTIRLPRAVPTGTTIRVIGYRPYTHVGLVDATTLDVPDEKLWVPLLAARAEIYRRQLNKRMNFEQWVNLSRDNDVTVGELFATYRQAQEEFEAAIAMFPKQFAGDKSAIFTA